MAEDESLADWSATRTAAELVELLRQHGIATAPSLPGSALVAMPRLRDWQVLETSPDGSLVKGVPFLLEGVPFRSHTDSPQLGEHTARFLEEQSRDP